MRRAWSRQCPPWAAFTLAELVAVTLGAASPRFAEAGFVCAMTYMVVRYTREVRPDSARHGLVIYQVALEALLVAMTASFARTRVITQVHWWPADTSVVAIACAAWLVVRFGELHSGRKGLGRGK